MGRDDGKGGDGMVEEPGEVDRLNKALTGGRGRRRSA